MYNYGEVLKKLRESRGMSLNELSKSGIISTSQLSNVENGISSLTVDKFFQLLDRLDTPLEVFQLLIDKPVAGYRDEISLILSARKRRSINELLYLKNKFKENEQFIPRYYQLYLLSEVVISSLNGQPVKRKVINELKRFFDKEEGGDYFRVILFTNTFFVFEPTYVLAKLKRIERKIELYSEISRDFDKEYILHLNVINFLIVRQYNEEAQKRINALKNRLDGTYRIYELEKLKYLQGKLLILSGEIEDGRTLCEKAISRMEEYNWKDKVEASRKALKKLLEDS